MSTTKKTVKEIAVVEDSALTESAAFLPNASGLDITPEDIDVPRLNIVQKLSSIEAPLAAIVLDKQHVLAHENEPLNATVISVTRGWRENVPYESSDIARIAKRQEEADEIQKDSKYGVIEFAEITLLFEAPEENENEEAYPLAIGDKFYALGRLNVQKDAYKMTYKRITTFAAFNPQARLSEYQWTLKSVLLQRGNLEWYAPSLTITKNHTDEAVINFIGGFGN
tara:strand:- start:1187 stop:1861 length:675 start_codon:yes stop_codon:yes gene_type:complete